MPDIKKTYSGEEGNKTVILEIDENVVGLNNFNVLSETVTEEMVNGISSFKFDMKNLNSINSSGLGILIGCLKKIKESNGTLKVVNANEKITGIFKLTKLDNVFEL